MTVLCSIQHAEYLNLRMKLPLLMFFFSKNSDKLKIFRLDKISLPLPQVYKATVIALIGKVIFRSAEQQSFHEGNVLATDDVCIQIERQLLLSCFMSQLLCKCNVTDDHRRTGAEPSLPGKISTAPEKNCYANLQNCFARLTPPSNY